MTPDEFLGLMGSLEDHELVAPCLIDDVVPYAFNLKPDSWNTFRNDLSDDLSIAVDDVRVVGSGRFGFSMKPWAQLKAFSDASDIDVAIVNQDLFDEIWFSLLEAAYPRDPMPPEKWLKARRAEVYTGWFSPVEIKLDTWIFGIRAKRVLNLRARWFGCCFGSLVRAEWRKT